jgi:iron complex outermembrane receptor protein
MAQEVERGAGDEIAEEAEEEDEVIIVQGTRLGRRVQDEPIRVEIIAGEEIEEKAIMRPGNIAMLVNETGGVRVQVTSPALGEANIRIQGLEGRYTQLLADNLPLYGGQAASLGLLQVPPTDLAQVEVIKGAASALYGPSALGGVINLISKRPGSEFEADILANATTRDGQDLTAYLAGPLGGSSGLSLTAGAHRQGGQDLDGDGWYDMPAYDRLTARPRFQWEGGDGSSLYLTLGAMTEDRVGGTLPGRTVPDGAPFAQTQNTERYDAGLVAEKPIEGFGSLHLRASAMRQDHLHRFGAVLEDDRHTNHFAEASVSGGGDRGTSWLGGIAFQSDGFRSDTFPAFAYTYDVPALFAQIEQEAKPDLTLAASARIDFHDEFGTQFSPRLSALYRPGNWTVRGSLGGGFFAPTPFVDEIEAAGLSRLEPLGDLEAETARTASLDVGYADGPWEADVTLFGANIENATRLEDIAPDRVQLVNVDGTTRVRGSELLLRFKQNGFTVTGSYVFVDATEPDPAGGRRRAPLTPRHTAGLVGMWEEHGKGRIGIEAYYTGRQDLDDNPYRTHSRPYLHLGILGEIVLGRVSLFANAENLLDVRQSRYDPLLLPQRAPSGQWTVDAWAPLEGFILNGGVRLRFGGH